jgi:DNA repair exonuclease SbcCD ATPase subunit
MTTPASAPPAAQRRSETGKCPSCGQPLRSQRAVRHLHKTEDEFEQILETAVRAGIAELAGELATRLEAAHQESLAQLQDHDVDEVRYSEDLDKLRTMFRQF